MDENVYIITKAQIYDAFLTWERHNRAHPDEVTPVGDVELDEAALLATEEFIRYAGIDEGEVGS